MVVLIHLIRDNHVLVLLSLCLQDDCLLQLVVGDKLKDLSSMEQKRDNLKVCLSIDIQEIEHYVLGGHAVDDFVNVMPPLLFRDVALWEAFSVKNKSDHPQNLVAQVELRLFCLYTLDSVFRNLTDLLHLFQTSRI